MEVVVEVRTGQEDIAVVVVDRYLSVEEAVESLAALVVCRRKTDCSN